MLRHKSSMVRSKLRLVGRSRTQPACADGRCVLAVASLCAASTAFLMLGLFIYLVFISPPGEDAATVVFFLFLTLAYGTLSGVRALKRAHNGAFLYGGEGMAVAGIVLNSLPAFFVVIWVCIAVLPFHVESSLVRLQDGCSSIAQEVYHIAGKR
jgi:hypothetical protein